MVPADEKAYLYALKKHASETRAEYLDRLHTALPPEELVGITTALLNSESERTRTRALELVMKVSGWLDQGASREPAQRGPSQAHLHIHTGNAEVDALGANFLKAIAEADGAD